MPGHQKLLHHVCSLLSDLSSGSIAPSGPIDWTGCSFSLVVSRRATIEKSSNQNSFSSNSEEAFMSAINAASICRLRWRRTHPVAVKLMESAGKWLQRGSETSKYGIKIPIVDENPGYGAKQG